MNMILHQISCCKIDGGRFIQNIKKAFIILWTASFSVTVTHASNQYSELNLEENRTKTVKQANSPVLPSFDCLSSDNCR